MPEPPPRKRFQLHLSTAIVLMFVAGGLIWANTQTRIIKFIFRNGTFEFLAYGWPCIAAGKYSNKDTGILRGIKFGDEDGKLSHLNLFIDIGAALLILLTTWLVCEWLIRHRAGRKTR